MRKNIILHRKIYFNTPGKKIPHRKKLSSRKQEVEINFPRKVRGKFEG